MRKTKPPFHYNSVLSHERVYLNEYGKHLRDQADSDYIASRSLFRRDLYIHSANLAHQAVEKYLKAILLFIEQDTRKLGHDLNKLLDKNTEFGLNLNEDSKQAIKMLEGRHNVTRYQGSGPFYINYEFIYYLDYFVRDIRPWVQNRYIPSDLLNQSNPKNIKSGHEYRSTSIHISGYLEQILKSKKSQEVRLKEDLIWNNPFFGFIAKEQAIKLFGSFSRNLPLLYQENGLEILRYVANFFKFEPEIERLIKRKVKGKPR